MHDVLETAKRYLASGLSVIPVPLGLKHPIIPWKEYQSRLATEKELQDWFSRSNNIGIVTGRLSDLLVIDPDVELGLSNVSKMGMLSSVSVLSGRGRHYWFHMPIEEVQNSQNRVLSIDVRAEGGIVLAPPSIHQSGSMYRFLTKTPFRDRPMLSDSQLVTLRKIQETQPDAKAESEQKDRWSYLLGGLSTGNRHQTFLSVLGRLRRDGYSKDDARRFLLADAERTEAVHILDEMVDKVWDAYSANPKSVAGIKIRTPQSQADLKDYEDNKKIPTDTLRTGFPTLDNLCVGGLRGERAFTIAARTGTGKTNLAVNLASRLCQDGKSVLYFSTEFSFGKIWDWFKETLPDPSKFSEYNFYVCDRFAPSVDNVEEAVKSIFPSVFIFDHINHISEEVKGLSDFIHGCNRIQRTYSAQGVVVAQLNRLADWVEKGERVEPRMSMIKGSSAIEEGSSRVLLLSEKRVTPEYNEIVAVLDKNDNGDKGMFHLALRKNPYRMEEI